MHILIVIVFVLALAYVIKTFLLRGTALETDAKQNENTTAQTQWGGRSSETSVAFLSDGKIFYKAAHDEVKQVHSPYIQEMSDKLEKTKERNAWKQNTSFSISANGGMRQFDADGAHILATSVQFDQGKSLLYFLKDAGMGGLFAHDLESGLERRILHKQNLSLSDLNLDVSSGKILCSSNTKGGIANLAMIDKDGNHFQELTGGDTLDSAPAWIPGAEKQILYQSAGIARAASGQAIAQGASSIQMLDLTSGNVTAVMEDPQFDFIHPRVCPQGNLHFIRRPYETPKYAAGNFLLDTLFFPFRLLRAVFHFLNFFSIMYSRKPLTSASGPALQTDLKEIILKGKRIDAEKALRTENKINGISSLVPKSWQLISRNRQGTETVLASNVVSYDITPEGSIIYSNGRGVFLLGTGDASTLILKSDLVADVIAR